MKTDVIENGYVKLTPSEGKTIECLINGRHHPEVVCPENQTKYYTEVSK